MFLSVILNLFLLAVIHLGNALPLLELIKRDNDSPGFLEFEIERQYATSLTKRAGPIVEGLTNTLASYLITLNVGTPSQPITLSLDTGSSDIWMYATQLCGSSCPGGGFDYTKSSSFLYQPGLGPFRISYFDNTQVGGIYGTDNIGVGTAGIDAGTAVVSNAVIALVNSTNKASSHGIMGIGLQGLESGRVPYPTFIDDLKNQGIISVRGYSIYLNSKTSSKGSILFGGYAPSKYQGDLIPVPIVPSPDGSARLCVQWTALSIDRTGAASIPFALPGPGGSNSINAVLDTGYTLTVLPNSLFTQFVTYFGAQNTNGVYTVPCDLGSGYVKFTFANKVWIGVPFNEFAIPGSTFGVNGCIFGFQTQDSATVVSLGDTFMRSAYTVFNYDDMTISLAPSKWDAACTNCGEALSA